MENAIKTLRIQNFKSIKDVTIQPRRVNLIIGMPNVGKSNILEAMSLLGGMFFDKKDGKFMEGQIRYEDIRNLFYDNDWNKEIDVRSENFGATRIRSNAGKIEVAYGNGRQRPMSMSEATTELSPTLNALVNTLGNRKEDEDYQVNFNRLNSAFGKYLLLGEPVEVPIHDVELDAFITKKYTFIKNALYSANYEQTYLRPPYGENMLDVLQYNGATLRKEIVNLFKPYGLNFVVRVADRKFEIQKNIDGYIYDYPYSLIADTLQRIIFYLAAIESNDDSVLLFEEPEAHTFPVYTSMLGRKIVESRNNQFFVATHSPYLVTEILEQMLPDEEQAGELAIFLAYYEDYQTKVKQLSDEEVRDIRGDSVDVFYNMARYTPRPANG